MDIYLVAPSSLSSSLICPPVWCVHPYCPASLWAYLNCNTKKCFPCVLHHLLLTCSSCISIYLSINHIIKFIFFSNVSFTESCDTNAKEWTSRSYLTMKKLCTQVETHIYFSRVYSNEVPQGSVLGPLIVCIFQKPVQIQKIQLYADNTMIHIYGITRD